MLYNGLICVDVMFSSLSYLLHVTLPKSRILRRLLEFWKICTHLRNCIFIYTRIRKYGPSLRRFSRKSQMLNKTICRSLILNATQIWSKCMTYG